MDFLSILAFLAPMPVALDAKPKLPTFTKGWRFWWSDTRLDARPVIWSLYNHPEEWEVENDTPGYRTTIIHKPSRHVFVVGRFLDGEKTRLRDSHSCSCISLGTHFHTGQATSFKRAARKMVLGPYRAANRVETLKQFISHFDT